MPQVADHKDRARETWAKGDYDAMMRQEQLYGVGERLVGRMGIQPGEAVLDVACGTGNAAIPAARAGAEVTGVDLSPAMLGIARQRARSADVEVAWTEGDVEALPFDAGRFDVVLSTFGCMFAPRHEVAAEELARVLRPGGRMGVCSWSPQGVFGDFFRIVAGYLPPDPEFVDPPLLWGDETHVRELFEGTGMSLTLEHDRWEISHDSAPAAVECYTTSLGPLVVAHQLAEADGRAEQLRDDLTQLFTQHRPADADRVAFPAEYLVAVGRLDA